MALELDGAELPTHVDDCADCRAKLAELRQASDQLAAAHADLNGNHAASRAELLARLPRVERSTPSVVRLKRVAFGGLGLTAAAALLLAAFFAIASNQLSAMERIMKAVSDISSFSCKLTNTMEFPPADDKPARTHHDERFIYWRAPPKPDQFGDMHGTTTISTVHHLPAGDAQPVELVDVVEIHPSGKRGILIDYLAKRYFRVPPLHASDIANSPPLLWLRAVREKAGRLVEDLGSRAIRGRQANGYLMSFDTIDDFDNYEPVEVWIDPETDLPVEFRFRRSPTTEDEFTEEWSITDIEWNHDLDPKLFDTTPPAGCLDITLPNDKRSIAEVIAALKLYAELSGGHYPRVEKLDGRNYVTKFDAEACFHEMLELAGFTGPSRDEWGDDPRYQRIEQARPGLDTLERIFHNPKWLIGYDNSMTPEDRDKVLLWWNVALDSAGDRYRLIYGDLRTEIVPGEEWKRHVPPEIAELTE